MTPDAYRDTLDRCGGRLEIIERRERWRLLQRWRECYAAGLHFAKGKWKLGGYEWHVFSFGYAPALRGRRAVAAYRAQPAGAFVVCPELESMLMPAVRITGGALPDLAAVYEDMYVWPEDLSWSMAFTHEGLGPYFSRAEWVTV
jgi:hypothetical protein